MIGRGDDLLRSTRRVEGLPHKALAAGEAGEIATLTRGGRSSSAWQRPRRLLQQQQAPGRANRPSAR